MSAAVGTPLSGRGQWGGRNSPHTKAFGRNQQDGVLACVCPSALRHGSSALCHAGAVDMGSALPWWLGRALCHLGVGLPADVAPLSPALVDPNPSPSRLGSHRELEGAERV